MSRVYTHEHFVIISDCQISITVLVEAQKQIRDLELKGVKDIKLVFEGSFVESNMFDELISLCSSSEELIKEVRTLIDTLKKGQGNA